MFVCQFLSQRNHHLYLQSANVSGKDGSSIWETWVFQQRTTTTAAAFSYASKNKEVEKRPHHKHAVVRE